MRTAEALKIAAEVIDLIEFRSGTISDLRIEKNMVRFSFELGLTDATKEAEQIKEKSPEEAAVVISANGVFGGVAIKIK